MIGEADGDDLAIADGGVRAEIAAVHRALRRDARGVFKHETFHAQRRAARV